MKPKDKAIELLEAFKPLTFGWSGQGYSEECKKCVLIVVEDRLKNSSLSAGWAEGLEHMPLHDGMRPYWEEIKKHVEELTQ